MRDMEQLHVGHSETEKELTRMSVLAPFATAQSIFDWRSLGYSWREIGGKLEMDHSAVRRAYFGELGWCSAVFPPGESPKMLSWSRPSRAEDRIESWLVQRHQERRACRRNDACRAVS